jgi:uncharacterized membrane protein YsdA (DUF1294 family)
MINYIVGYFIGINLISLVLVYIKGRTDFFSMSNKIFNIICVVLSMAGGIVGVLLGAEMSNYEEGNKLFTKWIPFIFFIEFCIVVYIIYQVRY